MEDGGEEGGLNSSNNTLSLATLTLKNLPRNRLFAAKSAFDWFTSCSAEDIPSIQKVIIISMYSH